MHPYKVTFLASELRKKKRALSSMNEGIVDGFTLAQHLEALLIEEHKLGYEVFNISPIASNIDKFGQSLSITNGLVVTFKQMKNKVGE